MEPANGYEVTIGTYKTRGKRFLTLVQALEYAVNQAAHEDRLTPSMVWENSEVVVAVVTSDVNGLTCHRLKWEGHIDDDEKEVWNLIGASPGFNRQPRKRKA